MNLEWYWQVIGCGCLFVLAYWGLPYFLMLVRHGGDRKAATKDLTDGDRCRDVAADSKDQWAATYRWLDGAAKLIGKKGRENG
jgi:hypothetical protein